jgi:hypothetical protein
MQAQRNFFFFFRIYYNTFRSSKQSSSGKIRICIIPDNVHLDDHYLLDETREKKMSCAVPVGIDWRKHSFVLSKRGSLPFATTAKPNFRYFN